MLNHLYTGAWIAVFQRAIIGTDNGLPFEPREAITFTNDNVPSIRQLKTHLTGKFVGFVIYSFVNMLLKLASVSLVSDSGWVGKGMWGVGVGWGGVGGGYQVNN